MYIIERNKSQDISDRCYDKILGSSVKEYFRIYPETGACTTQKKKKKKKHTTLSYTTLYDVHLECMGVWRFVAKDTLWRVGAKEQRKKMRTAHLVKIPHKCHSHHVPCRVQIHNLYEKHRTCESTTTTTTKKTKNFWTWFTVISRFIMIQIL